MVMPSAMGSENGTPISTTSAALPIWVRCSRNFARLGYPAVMKATMAVLPGAAEMAALILSLGFMDALRRFSLGLLFGQYRSLQGGHVLVATAGEADEHALARVLLRPALRAREGMRGFDG